MALLSGSVEADVPIQFADRAPCYWDEGTAMRASQPKLGMPNQLRDLCGQDADRLSRETRE